MAKKATSKEAPEATPEKKSAKKTTDNTVSEESAPQKTSRSPKAASPVTEEPEPAAPAKSEVLDEHIQVAAYFRWVDRGMPFGTPEEDWNEAEKQFRE
ncbi:MAG: DUF2934 domain-containing protein [Chlorobiaceae bacterium]|jgi:hypothetical protein|nr:DUF2934 domain-containing protein [Chlorobiaceae bacterium]